MNVSEVLANAQALNRNGDYRAAIDALYQVLRHEPAYFEADAAAFVASFPKSDRSQFWAPPPELFPKQSDLRSVFEFIYKHAVWGDGSGGGSDIRKTVLYVAYVQAIMDLHNVRTVIDLGCGDWRFSQYLDFGGRNYLGFDIVPTVVAKNIERFGTRNIKFELTDVSTMRNALTCDLLICKDVLQHLSNQNAAIVLENCRAARLALITNDYHPQNAENVNGGI